MSDLSIELHWQRAEPVLQTGKYSNEHTVQFNTAFDVLVDSALDWGVDPANTNPEQALAFAPSSCHMMPFWRWPQKQAGPWQAIMTLPRPIWVRTLKARCRSRGSIFIPKCVLTPGFS
ncbi:hypothetical protein ASD8599_01370 [Ascidiaceihabitans donghaensis]|uniref:Uncharacterized protein n=1 Tax=Ascidiaceihabitans donghaensis TaxID=1510460 RepID=A0A2R8BC30_9RHOB|nr:hypothetical protein ASD8599_01370 [Ascidiaceihabitans donghaensis]